MTVLAPPPSAATEASRSAGTDLRLPPRAVVLLGGATCLNLATLSTLFLPWRAVDVVTSGARGGRPLSAMATGRAIDAVHHALAVQSVLRAGAEIVVLFATAAAVVIASRSIVGRSGIRWRRLFALACTACGCAGAACFVLPLLRQPTRLTVHLAVVASPASFVAFAATTLALVTVVALHPTAGVGSAASLSRRNGHGF